MGKLKVRRSKSEMRREIDHLRTVISYAGQRLGLGVNFNTAQFIAAVDQTAIIVAQARKAQQASAIEVDTAALDAELTRLAESAVAA